MLRSSLKFCVFGLATLVCSPLVLADSAKVKWSENGHYYQQISKYGTTWFGAKTDCQAKGGHLATLTSAPEQAFIIENMLTSSTGRYALGGTDENNGIWRWITGESWDYTYWDSYEPGNQTGEDYLAISDFDEQWYDVYATNTLYGYICEWSYENHIATASVPDFTGNGKHEIASLYTDKLNTKFYVRLKDSDKGTLINNGILFGTTAAAKPIAAAAIKDINNNGKPEVAVLAQTYNTTNNEIKPVIFIKDAATGAAIKTIAVFGEGYEVKDLSVLENGISNGVDAISVMASKAGVVQVQVFNPKTSVKVKQFTM